MWISKYEWERVQERLKLLEKAQDKNLRADDLVLNLDVDTGQMVLDHLGLTLKCKESQPDQFVIEKLKK